MPRPRLFYSSSNEWISSLVSVSRGLVSVGNCTPFPYVGTALSAGVALLELIQARRFIVTVGKTTDDLKYLAESVVTIMKLLQEETEAHDSSLDGKFLRLIVAIGTRMDLAEVAKDVSAVRSSVVQMQSQLTAMRTTETMSTSQDLVRFDKDFHALKIGDIRLEFETARAFDCRVLDGLNGDDVHIGWTDYKGYVKGALQTVRVYRGSNSGKSWTDFRSFLAEHSPLPGLPQLFGFRDTLRFQSLVFHEDFKTLDEYGASLPSSRDIVAWEVALDSDYEDLHNFWTQLRLKHFFNLSPFAQELLWRLKGQESSQTS
ncbi:hypothetical protein DFH06DRAFT_1336464 [Mycena polygramma]|nr:hypothetical protein DFH06DRAFT_1336464 [Mycena polygramma]